MASIDRIQERFGRDHRDLNAQKGDLAAWSYELIRREGIYESLEEVSVTLDVNSAGRADLPCNIYRLLEVGYDSCANCNAPKYTRMETCLYMKDSNIGKVRIKALVYKTDDEGYPYIDDIMEDACYWYCLSKILQDAHMKGHLPEGQYTRIKHELSAACAAARSSFRGVTRNDLQGIVDNLSAMVVTRNRR